MEAMNSSSHKRKGLGMLAEIMKSVSDKEIIFLVAGKPTPGLGLKNVKELGFVENSRDVYKLADFLIHPAVYEPFGQIIAEALACGLPVLISDRCGASEIVSAKEGLVIPWNNTEAWKKAIESIQTTDFTIPPDWPERKKISTSFHMNQMLEYFSALPD